MVFNKQYNENDLKKLKQAEINILKDIIAVCEKYDIQYFVTYGTLIGAMRHRGFIPWDDDLDIAMCRHDYIKFEKVFEKELGERYIFATPLKLKGYCSGVTKIMIKGTKFIPSFSRSMKCEMGINIDIFILDKADKNSKRFKKDVCKARFYSQLLFLADSPNPVIENASIIGKIERVLCWLIHYMICWIPKLPVFIYKKLDNTGKKSNSRGGHCLTSFYSNTPIKEIAPITEIFPLVKSSFESLSVSIPVDSDAFLTRIYGDYMQLPPVEKRINHGAEVIDFGENV